MIEIAIKNEFELLEYSVEIDMLTHSLVQKNEITLENL